MHLPNPAPCAATTAPLPCEPGHGEPMRTCAGCRKVDRQSDLVRVVATSTGRLQLQVGRHRAAGRGTYVHRNVACLQAALAGGFARSLRRRVSGLSEPAPWFVPDARPALGSSPAGATSVKNQEDHS